MYKKEAYTARVKMQLEKWHQQLYFNFEYSGYIALEDFQIDSEGECCTKIWELTLKLEKIHENWC